MDESSVCFTFLLHLMFSAFLILAILVDVNGIVLGFYLPVYISLMGNDV